MKKKSIIFIVAIIVLLIVSLSIFRIKEEENDNLEHITVAEVAHSIFYAPQYVADSLGYFEDEGLDVEFVLTSGANNVMASVLSGDCDIGLSGTEATIYVYNGGEEDYVMTFAGLTQRDGSFLVARDNYDKFEIKDLIGKNIIGGRVGGMPEMTFEWVLRENGIDPKKDVNIDTSIAFPAMEGAFISGIGDFVTLFEPNATSVEKNGYGHVVAYVGKLGGNVPYTAYNAKKSFIMSHKDIISKFSRAIYRGLKYVDSHTSSDIGKILIDYFPDTDIEDINTIISRYKEGDAWKKDITISIDEWNHIQDIIDASGELSERVDYDKLIYSNILDNYE